MFTAKKFISSSLSICLVMMIISWSQLQTLLAQPQVHVTVLEPPEDGQEVGITMLVKGTAVLPKDTFLWVLAHRVQDHKNAWWPQGEVEVDPKNSTWTKQVKFGEEHDIGYQFEIAVIALAKEEHEKLSRYWFMVKRTGRSHPIKMPPTTSPPTIRNVQKVSHEEHATLQRP